MAYAKAAKSGSSGNSGDSSRENGRYFNKKLLVCMADGFCCQDVADVLFKKGFLRFTTGIQTLDFNRRIGIQIDDDGVRTKILTDGLVIRGHTITFSLHSGKDTTRVYVNQLPLGISREEVRTVFVSYGHIGWVQPRLLDYHGMKIPNGEWCIHFYELPKHIPSYVMVRGWRAYVSYRGQHRTCRICDETGHIARLSIKQRQ